MFLFHASIVAATLMVVASDTNAFDQYVMNALAKQKHSFPLKRVMTKYPGLAPTIKSWGSPHRVDIGKITISEPFKAQMPELSGFQTLNQLNGQMAQSQPPQQQFGSNGQGFQGLQNTAPEIIDQSPRNNEITRLNAFDPYSFNKQSFAGLHPLGMFPAGKVESAPFSSSLTPVSPGQRFQNSQIQNFPPQQFSSQNFASQQFGSQNLGVDPKSSFIDISHKPNQADINAAAQSAMNTKTMDFNQFLQSQKKLGGSFENVQPELNAQSQLPVEPARKPFNVEQFLTNPFSNQQYNNNNNQQKYFPEAFSQKISISQPPGPPCQDQPTFDQQPQQNFNFNH